MDRIQNFSGYPVTGYQAVLKPDAEYPVRYPGYTYTGRLVFDLPDIQQDSGSLKRPDIWQDSGC